MSTTIHEYAVREAFDNFCRDPRGYPLMLEIRDRMNLGDDSGFESYLIDFTTTKWDGSKYDVWDAYCFSQIRSLYLTGELVMTAIPVARGPCADVRTDLNREILASIPAPFEVSVWNGSQSDCDGQIKWRSPVTFRKTVLQDDDSEQETAVMVSNRFVPLEIGTTKSSRSLTHVNMRRGLARWPYDSSYVLIGVLTNEWNPNWAKGLS